MEPKELQFAEKMLRQTIYAKCQFRVWMHTRVSNQLKFGAYCVPVYLVFVFSLIVSFRFTIS